MISLVISRFQILVFGRDFFGTADCQNFCLWHSVPMKLFLVMAFFAFCLLPVARAQQEADERYVTIYNLIQQGDSLANGGQAPDALSTYTDAQARLQKFQKMYPNWDPSIINYRLDDLNKKINQLQIALAPKPAANTSGAGDDTAVRLQSQVGVLQQQVQSAQAENQALQAKLKEALATQPAVIDASELTAAQDQIRELMKENDLLKVTPGGATQTMVVADTNQVTALKQQLADTMRQYQQEHDRAQTLVQENTSLQRNIAKTGPDSQSLDVISSENDRLRTQLAALQKASDSASAAGELAAKLNDAKTQIANLQSAAALASLEKAGLENKVRKLSAQLAESSANFDAQIRDLTQQRNDLVKQLAGANSRNSGKEVSNVAAQMTELNNEVNVLRSRIAVDESKAIPYTDDELALFKQATPQVEQPVQKSVAQMPAGTANLVASAQRHFSSHEFEAAEADYQQILDRDQNNGLALANLATIELQEGKYDLAEKHIKAALTQSPEDAYNLSTLGYLKFREEKYDDALDALSHAVRIDPNNPETQNYLGVTLSHKGLRMQAETALRRALQLDPNYAPAHNNIAVIYLSQNPPLPQLARWHYQKALDAGEPPNAELEKMLAEKGAPMAH